MLLDGKTVLITGVLTPASIAFSCARIAQEQGATVVLTSFGRVRSLTERSAKRLPESAEVIELDVSSEADLAALAGTLGASYPRIDGVVHAIGFAPEACLGHPDGLFGASWAEVATTLQVSAWSLPALAGALRPRLAPGSSIVGLDF